jgi:hypothetical protein
MWRSHHDAEHAHLLRFEDYHRSCLGERGMDADNEARPIERPLSTQCGHSRMLEQLQLMQRMSVHIGQEMHRDKKSQAKR